MEISTWFTVILLKILLIFLCGTDMNGSYSDILCIPLRRFLLITIIILNVIKNLWCYLVNNVGQCRLAADPLAISILCRWASDALWVPMESAAFITLLSWRSVTLSTLMSLVHIHLIMRVEIIWDLRLRARFVDRH